MVPLAAKTASLRVFADAEGRMNLSVADIGGGVLAIDLVEHPQMGLVVNEINHTMEFHTMQPVSGIDIAGEIVEYVMSVAREYA